MRMWCLRVLTVGKKGLSKEAVEGFLRGCELDEVVPKRKVDHERIGDEVGDVDLECEEFAASMLDRRRGCCCRWVELLVGRDMAFACDAGVGEVGGIVRSIWSRTSMARR